MAPIAISLVAFALALVGILLGSVMQRMLPEGHLSSDSKEVVKLSMGVVATLAALVPAIVDRIWREGQSAPQQSTPFKASAEGEAFYQRVQELQPSNDIQRGLKERVIQVTTDLAQARFLLFSHLGSSIPVPFLAVLLLWMTVLFAGFSLMAPANATTLASLVKIGLDCAFASVLELRLVARGARRARPAQGSGARQASLARPGDDQIGKRVLVQNLDERFHGLPEHAVDRCRPFDAAGERRAAHAFGLDMGRLGDADHVTDADLLRRPRELEASGAASTRGYEAAAHEDRHDLRHVELRDAVLGRDIGSLDVLAAGERAMDQNPEGVAGLLGQSHGSISEGPNYTRSRACQ